MTTSARTVELPVDPTIDLLDDAARRAIGAHWLHRASAELGVAITFEELRPRLADVGAASAVLALTDKAIADERRHGALCVRLAARYLDTDVTVPLPRGGPLPDFGTHDERLEVALLVTGTCCVNESIASEWIRSCWQLATAKTAIMANRTHLQDEIDHARLGWAHLASTAIDEKLRHKLRRWVPRMIEANVAQWKEPDHDLPAEGIAEQGHPSIALNEAIIDAAVRDVVLPGFAVVGIGS